MMAIQTWWYSVAVRDALREKQKAEHLQEVAELRYQMTLLNTRIEMLTYENESQALLIAQQRKLLQLAVAQAQQGLYQFGVQEDMKK